MDRKTLFASLFTAGVVAAAGLFELNRRHHGSGQRSPSTRSTNQARDPNSLELPEIVCDLSYLRDTLVGRVDAALDCRETPRVSGRSHEGNESAGFYDCGRWSGTASVDAKDRRCITVGVSNGHSGGFFELAFRVRGNAITHLTVEGASFGCVQALDVFEGLAGKITLSTLDWREGEPLSVRIELDYFYAGDPKNWSHIDVCTRAEFQPPK